MLKQVLTLAIIAAVLFLLWVLAGMIVKGTILLVVGIILILFFLLAAVKKFEIDI